MKFQEHRVWINWREALSDRFRTFTSKTLLGNRQLENEVIVLKEHTSSSAVRMFNNWTSFWAL